MTRQEFEKLTEDYKDSIVNAVLAGQSNPRLGDMQDANRLVDEARNALIAAYEKAVEEVELWHEAYISR